MLLKMAGVILILSAGTGYGFSRSLALSCRERNLEDILRMTVLLRGELRFGNASLGDAFFRMSGRVGKELGRFLTLLSRRMKENTGMRFGELFRRCAETALGGMKLSEKERESLYALGESLGYLDAKTQQRQLELFEKDLELALYDLRVLMPSKKKVYQSMGILGAVLLAVLVW